MIVCCGTGNSQTNPPPSPHVTLGGQKPNVPMGALSRGSPEEREREREREKERQREIERERRRDKERRKREREKER